MTPLTALFVTIALIVVANLAYFFIAISNHRTRLGTLRIEAIAGAQRSLERRQARDAAYADMERRHDEALAKGAELGW